MNKNKIIKPITYIGLMLMLGILAACNKRIFDKQDLNGVEETVLWSSESATTLFLNKTYDLVMPNWPVAGAMHNTSDETNSANTTLLWGQLTDNLVTDVSTSNSATTNQYFNIRRCNLAIQGIESSPLPDSVKLKLKGQFYFLRSFVYFNLVKLYGGMPLILQPQNIAVDNVNVPRSKTSVCIDSICRGLDSCYALPGVWPVASTDRGKITRGAALALKGKVLMFWASAQFNPSNDVTRWERAYQANKSAYDTLTKDGYALNPVFTNIFLDESANNREPIILRNYDAISISPGRGTNIENLLRPSSESTGGSGSYQPTWNLVQAFTMSNGVPITDAGSGYDPLMFWKNRDPRFEATIAYNGDIWPLSGKAGRKQWNYIGMLDDGSKVSPTGFYCKKISNPSISATAALYNSNTGGGSGMDWLEMRFAEVLLNLAECANESNRAPESASLVIKLRQRAGILLGNGFYGLPSASVGLTQMRTIIMNERQVEFAMEGKRYDDLRRTRLFTSLNGTIRTGYTLAMKSPYVAGAIPNTGAVAGKIYIDVLNAQAFRPRDTINIANAATLNAIFIPTLVSFETGGYTITFPDNYYFYPLPQNFLLSSSSITQTLGWPGGSFDPLQ